MDIEALARKVANTRTLVVIEAMALKKTCSKLREKPLPNRWQRSARRAPRRAMCEDLRLARGSDRSRERHAGAKGYPDEYCIECAEYHHPRAI